MRNASSTRWAATLTILAAGIAARTPALAGEAHVYISPYAFDSKLTGTGQVSDGSPGTKFDLEDTLGLDTKETAKGLDGFVKFLGSRIDFGYYHSDYSGGESLSNTLVFNGTTYAAGETVHSKIDLTHYRLMYGFDFGIKVVNVGFLIGGHLVDVDARVKSSPSGRESEELRAPVPVVGVTLGIHPISQIAIHAEVSGMAATAFGVKARLFEGFAGINYLPFARFGIVAGYRYFTLDAEDNDAGDKADLKQRGPYAGIAFHL
jgi:hypothetical protein